MKLRKVAAVTMTVAMTAAMFAGCGNSEKADNDSSSDKKETKKEASASSFSETLMKAYEYENYSYEMSYDFSVTADEIETALSSDEDTKAIFDSLGISGDTLKGKLSFEGKVKGTDALQMEVSLQVGDVTGVITEVIYVDDTVYVNIAKTADFVYDVADKIGYGKEVETYLKLLPEGDYVEIPMSTIEKVAESLVDSSDPDVTMMQDIMENLDEDTIKDAVTYVLDEVEKIAKKADALSDSDGYVVTFNKDNAFDWIKNGADILVADMDTIYDKAKELLGSDFTSQFSKDDMDTIKDSYDELEDEDWDDLEKQVNKSLDEVDDFDVTINAKDEGDALNLSMSVSAAADGAKVKVGFDSRIKEEDVSIKAPESIISKEDIEALLSMAGIDSLDDLESLITGAGTDYYGDYEYDDAYDYDYDDYDFSDYDFN